MRNKAQTTLEYMVLFAVIVAALVGMQVYLKRGMQGRVRGYTEQLTQGSVYSPGATSSFIEVTTNTLENSVSHDKVSNSEVSVNQLTEREENLSSFANEPRRW